MSRHLALKPLTLFSAVILTMGFSYIAMAASDTERDRNKKPTSEASKQTAKSDPLQACLEKIPKDATFGQRLLAEQSCMREDEQRKQAGDAGRF